MPESLNLVCGICYDEVSDDSLNLACYDIFCEECLVEYLTFKINCGQITTLSCANHKC